MNDLVSILVPIYNVEKYIERCAVSLFEQTYENIEYIFVDDCSPDNSVSALKKVVEKYPNRKDRVFIIKHQYNQGLAAARNTALEAAHGKYVMHVDSDDYIDKFAVEKSVCKMHKEKADVVIFGMNHVYKDKIISEVVEVPNNPKEYAAKLIARECPVCMCGGLYLRSLYMDNDVRAIPGLNMGEDYATKPRVVYFARKIASLDEPLYYYVHYNEGAYTQNFKSSHIDNMLQAVEILEGFFLDGKSDGNLFLPAIQEAKAEVWGGLLISWGLNDGKKQSWDRLHNLYPKLTLENVRFSRKIIIIFARRNLKFMVKLYVKFGFKLKQLLKR